jgi:uncharacterized protein (DUF362 family)
MRVAIYESNCRSYPKTGGFSPSKRYPEYLFEDLSIDGSIYDAVREAFRLMGLDNGKFGTPAWNPLGDIVRPGDRVVVKPNLVLDFNASGETTDCLVTHASVLRPIIDYIQIALSGKGSITVADCPHGNADFEAIKKVTGLDLLQSYFAEKGIEIAVLDLRKYQYGCGAAGFIVKRKTVDRDPEGYIEIDLGSNSAFADLPHLENLYGADFNRREIRRYHNQKTNKYLVARTFLCADVIINVPKLKTHKKIGTTLNLKSLIGINGDKNYLPHFRINDPAHGGDETPSAGNNAGQIKQWTKRRIVDLLLGRNSNKQVWLFKLLKSLMISPDDDSIPRTRPAITAGNWYGNQTVYRTVYDLSKILFLADRKGVIQHNPQRRFFSIIDGIVAGEKEGPLEPSPKPCGVIICGFDPVAVDLTATRLMGFDTSKMAIFNKLSSLPPDHSLRDIPSDNIEITSNQPDYSRNIFATDDPYLALVPHSGWQNYLEVKKTRENQSKVKPPLSGVKV